MRYTDKRPLAAAFKSLYDTTGWGPLDRAASFYEDALSGSWAVCSVYDDGQLIGFGRVISDGRLHAFITEMIVAPSHQGKGIGQSIIEKLLASCHSAGITDIQLFAAQGKEGFYLKHGFISRSPDRPGMQYAPPREADSKTT